MTLLSTYHQNFAIDSNDPEKKPEIIKFYNHTKGGVDILDQLVGTYRCKRKVNRWPVAIFCNMLDISAVNAFKIFIALNPGWNIERKGIRRRLFLIELGEALCRPYIQKRQRLPHGVHALALVQNIRHPRPSTSQEEDSNEVPEAEQQLLVHQPVTKKKARCHLCPSRRDSNNHATRCDNCVKYVCPLHYYKLCEKCLVPT